MSNLDPKQYKNGELVVGETVTSDSPKVELGKAKAVFAGIAAVAVSVGTVLTASLADGAIDLNEGIALGLALLGGLGVGGLGTYAVPTKVTRKA